jgi:3D (Asp-Asp-Asp) domain-containing protein
MSFVEGANKMNKFAAITMTAVVINLFSPLAPQAHAAILEDKVVESIAQNINGLPIQELAQIKTDLEQANRTVIMQSLAKAALTKIPSDNMSGITNIAATNDLGQVVQAVISKRVDDGLTNTLSSYQNELTALSMLFKGDVLSPQTSRDNTLTGAPQNYSRVLDMTATAYGPGVQDNGKWNNLTYMGGTVRKGVAAVDPTVIPMGSRLWIEGYGEAIAEDQGSAIKGNRIDLAFNSRQEALDYGIKPAKVYVLN